MRVLDTITGRFHEIDPKKNKVKYAILSHTWDSQGEQTYEQLRAIQKRHAPSDDDDDDDATPSVQDTFPHCRSDEPLLPIWADPKLSPKIRESCRVARENGYRYLWIDSCCIDKMSSSELSESINSMYQWYALADICYAFLADVPAAEEHGSNGSHFRDSRWFTRGWTLQELIAPMEVVFLAQDWTVIGSKFNLGELTEEITKIDYSALLHIEPLDDFSVAQRFSWASRRETTRVEDQAYSLLGIFDITMPTVYGEGDSAFRRLQEEIMRRTPDQTLFAWTSSGLPEPWYQHTDRSQMVFGSSRSISLLAPSLRDFSKCADIETLSHDEVVRRLQLPADYLPVTDYDFTPYGIRIQLPVINFSSSNYSPLQGFNVSEALRITGDGRETDVPGSHWYLVILGCVHRDHPGHLLGRVCIIQPLGSNKESLYSGFLRGPQDFSGISGNIQPAIKLDLFPISTETLSASQTVSSRTVYIPQLKRLQTAIVLSDPFLVFCRRPHDTIRLLLRKQIRRVLFSQGYGAVLHRPNQVHPTTYSLVLAHRTHRITIDVQYSLEHDHIFNQKLTVEAQVKLLVFAPNAPGGIQGFTTRVSQTDIILWHKELRFDSVKLEIPGAMTLKLKLGLIFLTKDHYELHIELIPRWPQP